ncbi:MAG: glutamate mutase L [Chloroflexota bacterium]
MAASLVAADSLVAIDVGTIYTRALLFDVVDGQYRFLAMGVAPTTAEAPYRDIGEGIHLALEQLQSFTGRSLLGTDGRLVIPGLSDGTGVDRCVATISAGRTLKAIAYGLLEDISTESAAHLATTTYAQVVDAFSLNDRRKIAARIDAILRHRPDVVIVAGGTDGGASQSVMNALDAIGLASELLPERERPEILYAGNQDLAERVKATLKLPTLHVAPNLRPTLDTEQLEPAQLQLSQLYRQVRIKNIAGVQELDMWANGELMPTSVAFGRLIRFFSRISHPRAVLGLDVGASSTTVAAGYNGELSLRVDPQLGLGESLAGLSNHIPLHEITRWVAAEVSDAYVRDYLHNKALHPYTIPATHDDLAIEQALARQLINMAFRRASRAFPAGLGRGYGLSNRFGPLVASGSVLVNAATRGQTLLTLLDALQPTGMVTLYLDQNQMAASLGAAANTHPILTVQVFETGTFMNLGTVISPVGHANRGTPILKAKITYPNQHTAEFEVKYGTIEPLPLGMNQTAKVQLQPYHRFDIGNGPGVMIPNVNVIGGLFGLVIDARGRPVHVPAEPAHRAATYKKWCAVLDGS